MPRYRGLRNPHNRHKFVTQIALQVQGPQERIFPQRIYPPPPRWGGRPTSRETPGEVDMDTFPVPRGPETYPCPPPRGCPGRPGRPPQRGGVGYISVASHYQYQSRASRACNSLHWMAVVPLTCRVPHLAGAQQGAQPAEHPEHLGMRMHFTS